MDFCNAVLRFINEDRDVLKLILISDEDHFHTTAFVNKQNTRYWAPVKHRKLHVLQLHSPKVREYFEVGTFWIIGTFFSEYDNSENITATAERYVSAMPHFLLSQSQHFVLTPATPISNNMEQQHTLLDAVWTWSVISSIRLFHVLEISRGQDVHRTSRYQNSFCGHV